MYCCIPLIERTEQLDRLPMRLSEIPTTQSSRLMRVRRFAAHLAMWAPLAAIAVSGCTVGPKYHKSWAPVPTATTYKEDPANFPEAQQIWKAADSNAAMLRGKWWEIFNDSELNTLEEQLDSSNQNIAQAYQNYIAAREIVQQARSQFFPTIGTTPAISRQRSSANLGAGVSGGGGTGTGTAKVSPTNLFELPGNVSWEPDLWGKVRNTVAEEAFAAQVSAADLRTRSCHGKSALRSSSSRFEAKMRCESCSTIPWPRTARPSITHKRSTIQVSATRFRLLKHKQRCRAQSLRRLQCA